MSWYRNLVMFARVFVAVWTMMLGYLFTGQWLTSPETPPAIEQPVEPTSHG